MTPQLQKIIDGITCKKCMGGGVLASCVGHQDGQGRSLGRDHNVYDCDVCMGSGVDPDCKGVDVVTILL